MAAPGLRLAICQSFALQFLILPVFVNLSGFCAAEDQRYRDCIHNFSCGESIREIGYPFWGNHRPQDCGVSGLRLQCSPDNLTTIEIAGQSFRVLKIDVSNCSMQIVRADLLGDVCRDRFLNTSLSIDHSSGGDGLKFEYSRHVEHMYLLYSCPGPPRVNISERFHFDCTSNDTTAENLNYAVSEDLLNYKFPSNESCKHNLTVPVMETMLNNLTNNRTMTITETTLAELVKGGFEVEYKMNATARGSCQHSSGLCCSGTTCHKGHRLNLGLKIGIASIA